MTILLATMLVLAALPFGVAVINLRLLKPPLAGSHPRSRVSVLIPARNEAPNIQAAIQSVLANGHHDFEVLVLDDHSTDATASIVDAMAALDRRVVLHRRLCCLPAGAANPMPATCYPALPRVNC